MSKYKIYPNLEWVTPIYKSYKFQCCDCGLVHSMDFRIRKGRVQFRCGRDNRATGQVRRHRNIIIEQSFTSTKTT